MARGFNTEVSDPLSVQSMKLDVLRGYDNHTVLSNASMIQSGRDFSYEWNTTTDGDGEYEVALKAYDSGNSQILSDMKRDVVIDFSVLMARELEAFLSRGGGREIIPFYHAAWSCGELQVEAEKAAPLQGDSLLVDIWFNEPVDLDTLDIDLTGGGDVPSFSLTQVEYDSTEFRWRGASYITNWESTRNIVKFERLTERLVLLI